MKNKQTYAKSRGNMNGLARAGDALQAVGGVGVAVESEARPCLGVGWAVGCAHWISGLICLRVDWVHLKAGSGWQF